LRKYLQKKNHQEKNLYLYNPWFKNGEYLKGRVLKPNNEVVETPHIADNNSIAGYIIVLAKNLDEATKIAKKCPILNGQNTSVEIRETATPG